MFVKNEAAMKIGNYLVVSDVHIGITKELWEAGVSLPSQVKSLAKRLNKLKRVTRAKYLIINGDLKHRILGVSPYDRREIPEFLEMLKFQKIIIIKGNHDGDIEKLVDDVKKVSVQESFEVGSYFITHGHRTAKTSKKIIVIGHNHLAIRFKDQIGATYTEPVWVRGKAEQKDAKGVKHSKTIIIMPAFNELSGYFTVNKGRFQGPVASLLKNPRIYMLDGTDLGRVSDIKLRE